jgi:signal transduction histidine kinase
MGDVRGFGERVSARSARRNDEVGRLAAAFNAMLDRLQGAYAALQDANTRLEATLESQRRFVADASHELRTPLTTVRGNASLLRRFDVLTPDDREAAVEQIASEAERMSRLVADLLTLARADAGQLLERKSIPLGALIDAVAQQGRVLADGKVSVSVVRTADATVMGDKDALRQLLLILADNAIKYTPAGGSVTLGLRLEMGSGSRRLAKVSVVDTGMGIAPADLPHVFERFYRADRARRSGGTGLGLSIGRWIAQAHGGDIAVESSPGAGSIFTVTLPALPAAPEDGADQAATRELLLNRT